MTSNSYELARKLAMQPYIIMTAKSETTDGQPIYNARTLEIENCIGQGETPEQAMQDLRDALADYIESLLEDGLPVPEPYKLERTTKTTAGITITLAGSGKRIQQKENAPNQDSYVLAAYGN